MKLLFLLGLFTLSQFSLGKIKPSNQKSKLTKSSLKKIKKDFQKQKQLVLKLGKEISSLENNLGQGNKRYIKVIENRKKIENRIFLSKKQIEKREKHLKGHHQEAKRLLTSAVLNSLRDDQGPAEMLGHKLLLKSLKKKVSSLEDNLRENQNLTLRIKDLESRYGEYISVESELTSLLNEMENKKKRVASAYLQEKEERDRLKLRYDTSKLIKSKKTKKRLKKKYSKRKKSSDTLISLRFRAPIKEYSGIEHKKKGVTFKFEGKRPVYPTHEGKVDYVGTLSNYGNVLIINHGDNTRSVIFGQFSPKIRKGQYVKSGQIIGYTDDSSSNGITSGKIYFEVRKKNKAQNTMSLMDKNWLAENNLTESSVL